MYGYGDLNKAIYTYDPLDRVQTATFYTAGAAQNTTFTYCKNDQVKSIVYPNNLYANYTYDKLARMSTMTPTQPKSGGKNVMLLSLTYNYNRTGTVASVTGSVNGLAVSKQYRYDALQRLTNSTVTSNGAATILWYEYDSVGNRLWQSQNSTQGSYHYPIAQTSYSYNSLNELTKACTTPSGSTCYTTTLYSYDKDGNLLTENATGCGPNCFILLTQATLGLQ